MIASNAGQMERRLRESREQKGNTANNAATNEYEDLVKAGG